MKSILKNSKAKIANLMKEVLNNDRKTYLVLELSPKRLYIEGCRIVLSKFVKAVYTVDLTIVIAQYKDNLEVSAAKVCTCMYECINST